MTLWSVVVTHLTTVAPLDTRRVRAGAEAVRSIVASVELLTRCSLSPARRIELRCAT